MSLASEIFGLEEPDAATAAPPNDDTATETGENGAPPAPDAGQPATEQTAPPVTPPAPPPGPPAPSADGAQMVPLAVVLGMRDEMRRLKAQLASQPAPPPPPPAPNFEEQPEDFVRTQIDAATAPLVEQLMHTRLTASYERTAQRYGDDTTRAALQWFKETFPPDSPAGQQFVQHVDPVGFVASAYRRARALEALAQHDFDPDAYARARASQLAPPPAPTPPASPQGAPRPATPPPSVAAAPAAGQGAKAQMLSDDEWFNSTFGRKR